MKVKFQYILATGIMLETFVKARATVPPVQDLKYFRFHVLQVRS